MTNRNRSGKSSEQARASNHHLNLHIAKTSPPPSFFHCPISLEVMRSPVSLCTGVTYDRSSIQRWLDSGNTTCPATMQPLPSTELIPNLTLHRLIHIWSSSDHNSPSPSLPDIARVISDPAADDPYKLCLLSCDALADADRRRMLTAALAANPDAAISGLVAVLKRTDYLNCRVAAARVVEMLIAEERAVVAREPGLLAELLRLVGESDEESVVAGLRCLIELVGAGRWVRAEMVRIGGIPALTNVVERDGVEMPAAAAEMAMRVLEAAVGCREGKAAFCAEAERCVGAVVGRMMRVGNDGREAAVAMLWRVCCAGGGDRRARKAAAAAKEGLGKILVVMQGDCSPLARKLAADLVSVFRENSKSSMAAAGYDSRTIHITPY